jgi:hypothetical protein
LVAGHEAVGRCITVCNESPVLYQKGPRQVSAGCRSPPKPLLFWDAGSDFRPQRYQDSSSHHLWARHVPQDKKRSYEICRGQVPDNWGQLDVGLLMGEGAMLDLNLTCNVRLTSDVSSLLVRQAKIRESWDSEKYCISD